MKYCILIDCLGSCACGVPGLSSQNCLFVNRPMTSLQIPQHATTRLLGVPRLLSVSLDTSTSCIKSNMYTYLAGACYSFWCSVSAVLGLVFQLRISFVGALAYITRHCHIWSRIICSPYLALKSEIAFTNCYAVFTLEGVCAE